MKFNVILMNESITIIIVININWAPDLKHNLFNIILFANKNAEVWLRGKGYFNQIIHNDYIYGFSDVKNN